MIVFLTSIPGDYVPGSVSGYDKIAHLGMYGVLGWLLVREVSMSVGRRWLAPALALIVASGFGAIDEWHQQYIPGRSKDPADWVADTVGAAAGALASAVFIYRRSRAASSE